MSKYEIIDNGDGTSTIDIPLIVPNTALELGGLEMFAKAFGWSDKIESTEEALDEMGNPYNKIIYIDNPESALDRSGDEIRKFVSDIFKREFVKAQLEKTEKEASLAVDSILGINK